MNKTLILIIISLFIIPIESFAASSCSNQLSGINRYQSCRFLNGETFTVNAAGCTYASLSLTNASGKSVFIPTNTCAEWDAFLNHMPNGVTISLLYGGNHNVLSCSATSGEVVSASGASICRFNGSSCPSGWIQYNNWSTTTIPTSCTCTGGGCCGGSFTATCLGGSWSDCRTPSRGHSWSNVAPEGTIRLGVKAGSCGWYDCCQCLVYSTTTQIGCY